MSHTATRVLVAQSVASNVMHLQLERPQGYCWKTGEFARLGLSVGGETVFRAYSIACPPESNTVDFFIANVTEGQLSPHLNALRAGSTVFLDAEVTGTLLPARLEPRGKNLWLFASGTGIAPFFAITNDPRVTEAYERIIVVHGTRTHNESAYIDDFLGARDKLTVVRSTTREAGAALSERIPDALESGKIEALAGVLITKTDSRVLLCGNPGMVKAVRAQLKTRGLVSPRQGNPGQVLAENFWL